MAWPSARYRRIPFRRPRRSGSRIIIWLVLAVAVAFLTHRLQPQFSVAGVTVIDGDSLRNATHEIRLYGIDAPELHQTCEDERGLSYACGREAKAHLARLATEAPACRGIETDRYRRLVARCEAGGRELNRAMVEDGWAVAYRAHSLDYVVAETAARMARRGIWRGRFETPQTWRDRRRNQRGHAEMWGSGEDLPPD